jgi:RNA polymerase sigma factor (sigma-70 family)
LLHAAARHIIEAFPPTNSVCCAVDAALPSRIRPDDLIQLETRLELIAVRMLGDQDAARDAVQETFVRLLAADRANRIPEAVPLGAFAYGVLRHVVCDLQRAAARERVGAVPERPAAATNPLDQLISDEEAAAVRAALQRIPAADRSLLERSFIDGVRVSVIAREAGEPEPRVRVRKLRALRRLRDALARNGKPS